MHWAVLTSRRGCVQDASGPCDSVGHGCCSLVYPGADMNALELCNAFVTSFDRVPGANPLRTFVDDAGHFTIKEGEQVDPHAVERCTGYVGTSGLREPSHTSLWRQLMLGAVAYKPILVS